MTDKKFTVINRSASIVHYSVPELGIKSRDFQPGESKQISYAELEGLSYMPGGKELIRDYLLIKDESAKDDLVGHTEPEYNMTKDEVIKLIQQGSLDEWLDCLDFAPEGVIDLIKTLAVELPLTDTRKMETFKEKKGFDISRMIQAKKEVAMEEEELAAKAEQSAPKRRVKVTSASASTPTARRTTGSQYKVVSKG